MSLGFGIFKIAELLAKGVDAIDSASANMSFSKEEELFRLNPTSYPNKEIQDLRIWCCSRLNGKDHEHFSDLLDQIDGELNRRLHNRSA